MSVYGGISNSSFIQNESSILPDISIDSLMLDESVSPCFEDNFITAAARISAESTINMNNILEACAIEEFCYLESTGTEMIYEEGKIAGFIEKAKQFFLKLWEKIKSIFKKAIMMFDSKAKHDKDFVNKYKKELNSASNKGFGDKEISIFKYIWYTGHKIEKDMENVWKDKTASGPILDLSNIDVAMMYSAQLSKAGGAELISDIDDLANSTAKADSDDLKKLIDKIDDKIKTVNESDWKTDYLDEFRATLINTLNSGKESSITASEFSKEVKEACQGGESSKEDHPLGNAVDWAKNFLLSSDNIKSSYDHTLKLWKQDIDKIVKALERAQKDFVKQNSKDPTNERRAMNYKHTLLSNTIQILQSSRTICITFHSCLIQNVKACSAQSRSICVQAINYKKPKNESTILGESGSLLDSVELI